MKKNKLLLGLAVATAGLALASCGGENANSGTTPEGGDPKPNNPVDNPLAGTYDAKLWVSEVDGMTELTKEQIKKFEAANPGIEINETIEPVSEKDAATQMTTDVAAGADIYCFAQDQLSTLVRAKALSKLGKKATEIVQTSHETGAVAASTVDENIMCYPLTADNGYFMYYDKRVVKEESVGSLEKIIADCEAAEKGISYNLLTNTWYNAGFFFGTGCKSKWEVDANGTFTGVEDNFNSPEGLIALKGMQKVLQSSMFIDSCETSDFEAASPSAVVVTGTWGAKTAKEILGDNLGAAPLPKYTVGDKTYSIGSFQGYKLMGVKPQTDNKRAAVFHQLAQFLTNDACQLERHTELGWGPSSKAAQQNEAVKNDPFLKALNEQRALAVVQGQIKGNWWDFGKAYAAATKAATTDEELQAALNKYQEAMDGLFAMSEDEKETWGVLGGFEDNNWANGEVKDVKMVQKPAGTYYTCRPIKFNAGDEFKLRQGMDWDHQIGLDGDTSGSSKNIVAPEAGYFYVKLVFNDEGKGIVTFEKFNPNDSYSVIGEVSGSNWDKDFYMTKTADNEYMSDVIELAAGAGWKVRKESGWDINFGKDNAFNAQENFTCETAGKYQVKMVVTSDRVVEITLIPVTE